MCDYGVRNRAVYERPRFSTLQPQTATWAPPAIPEDWVTGRQLREQQEQKQEASMKRWGFV